MNEEKISVDNRDYVGALASGLEVLSAFDVQHKKMTLSEVAQITGMDRAKARRLLLTLHALGYIAKEGRQFMLTPKVLRLGYAFNATNDHLDVVQHYLQSVTSELGESCSLSILDNGEIIYLVRSSAAHRLMSINITPGTRLPAAYTSMGRVLLAELSTTEQQEWLATAQLHGHTDKSILDKNTFIHMLKEVKQQGYCVVDQELELGLRSVAVPVFDYQGKLLGAANISTNSLRVSMDSLINKYLPALKEAAQLITAHAK
ncbi:IclR family transcriptional regulator C-terminal domain-containing protein [Aliiglaciecola sp. 3_MG-2023]|uniref:IclR family transcriptional regulator domain-containing protein n=1 Tax=Aliiglaciecola sp. 3_MG-2023 TaxID=3062644 RepID=UPI0026E26515|nr:IclR family transcriptional regulator C-terminal domain-containing protein [Aliiglaciecola sp. 3_MG-2023]MDO6693160.1 IclR family transcriptional regulator C-terminal domain-containing protein [Aliiglaciecola sp. 3_MG-2023]